MVSEDKEEQVGGKTVRKLCDQDVRTIRELLAVGNYTQTEVAKRFDVSIAWVSLLVRGKYRRDAGGPISVYGHRVMDSLEKRFWSKVDRGDVSECWEWLGSKDNYGYGRLGKEQKKAHRISYELLRGAIPEKVCVCHTCDNPGYVNPSHLFLGTLVDNNIDRTRKGRSAKGAQVALSKLTAEQVRTIRQRYAKEDVTMTSLGKEYGVVKGTIRSVVRRITWRHID